jgi:hypothetical protein
MASPVPDDIIYAHGSAWTTTMKKDISMARFFAVLLILFPLIQANGCGTTKTIYEKVSKTVALDKPSLKKRVLVLPIMDQSGLQERRVMELTAAFVDFLNEDEELLAQRSTEPLPLDTQLRSPRYGIIVDPDLAKRAEEMCMNVVVTLVISPFEPQSKKTGIWPFRGTKTDFEVSMVVNALDVTNGTLFLTNLESKRVKAREEGDFLILKGKEPQIDEAALGKALSDIVKDQASAVADALEKHPWSGRILSADEEGVMISAGYDIGLKAESVFEVFARGEPIRSASGRSLFLLGPKVGEVKTVQIMESYAAAVPLGDGQFNPGQVIRIKD